MLSETSLSPPVKIFLLTVPRRFFFCGSFCYLCIVFVMLSCLYIAALWSSAGKGLSSWLALISSVLSQHEEIIQEFYDMYKRNGNTITQHLINSRDLTKSA